MANSFALFNDADAAAQLLPRRLAPGLPPVRPEIAGRRNVLSGATMTDLTGSSAPIPVIGTSSVKISQMTDGGTVITIRRNSQEGEYLTDDDLKDIRAIGEKMLERLEAMSQGPYTLAMLRQMGHPYARREKPGKKWKGPVPTRYRGKAIGKVFGMRQNVPVLSVVNKQTGLLANSWDFDIARDSRGVTLNLRNYAPESWWTARGTINMVAHGPFAYVPTLFLSQIDEAWRTVRRVLHQRAVVDEQIAKTVQALRAAA